MSPPRWVLYGGTSPADLGYLPMMLEEDDPRPVKEQFDANYQHGGGWQPFGQGQWVKDGNRIRFPGDPWLNPLAVTLLRDEMVFFYPHAMVCIEQKDGSFEVARMD